MKSDPGQYIFWAVFAGVALMMVFRFIRFGGLRAAMFGAEIQRTVGEVKGTGRSIVSTALKVHVLGSPPEKAVGIEFVAKSFASYQTMPVSLSVAEAKSLITLLQAATNGR